MKQFFPHAVHTPGQAAGAFTGGGAKIVHHSTEGSTIAGAIATLSAKNVFPHFTDTFENGVYVVHQHLPLNVAARALEHPAGTGETNRDHCIQIEHVGFAAHMHGIAPGYIAGIAALCRFIEHECGVKRQASFPFLAPGIAHRLDWATFHHYSGHLGHQHVPNQPGGHTDPGRLPIKAILHQEALPKAA